MEEVGLKWVKVGAGKLLEQRGKWNLLVTAIDFTFTCPKSYKKQGDLDRDAL